QLAHGHAQGQFDAAGLVDVAADAVELRPVAAGVARVLRVGRHAHRLEPVGPAVHDVGDAGDRLDVVDDRRLAEGPLDRGEGRLDPRPGALAFEALDEPGLLAADVGAGAAVLEHVEVKVLAEDVAAEQVGGVGLVDGPLHGAERPAVLVAQVDVGGAGPRGVAGEDDAFEYLVRVLFHEDAVVEGAGLALVGVDAEVDRAGVVLGQEGPLAAGREAGTAAAAQARRLDHVDDLGRRHLVHGLGQGAVAAVGAVRLQGDVRLLENAAQKYGFKVGHA